MNKLQTCIDREDVSAWTSETRRNHQSCLVTVPLTVEPAEPGQEINTKKKTTYILITKTSPRTCNHKTQVDLSRIEHTGSCKDAQPPTGTLLPHQIQLILVVIVDPEFGRGAGGLGEHLVLADASSVREEFFLEVLGDPSFDDDVVGVLLDGVGKHLAP